MARIVVPRKDLKRQVFRAGGPGGQAQNKTSSAVRWVHVPTGISAESRTDRSQHANSDIAYERLMDRLETFVLARRKIRPRRGPASFGFWKRSYKLCGPQQDVQDVELEVTVGSPRRVLDGGIGAFVDAALRKAALERSAWVEEDANPEHVPG